MTPVKTHVSDKPNVGEKSRDKKERKNNNGEGQRERGVNDYMLFNEVSYTGGPGLHAKYAKYRKEKKTKREEETGQRGGGRGGLEGINTVIRRGVEGRRGKLGIGFK